MSRSATAAVRRLALIVFILGHAAIADGPVDATTLEGKLMCGYQGWFRCPGDGTGLGWRHWSRRPRAAEFGPGDATVDMWPDLTGFDADELFETGYRHRDGRAARVFSSANPKTVDRHFGWMREHDLPGAFLQRFGVTLRNDEGRRGVNQVLSNVRAASLDHGRVYAVMYDLSGLKSDEVRDLADDWRRLLREERVVDDPSYLRHRGRPLIAVWGIGFKDRHEGGYSLAACLEFVAALRETGCAIFLGVPTYWRTADRDAIDDPRFTELLKSADAISPWTVGRYRTPKQARKHYIERVFDDMRWCRRHGPTYVPVVFPGFSWENLKGEWASAAAIPRLRGRFFESQLEALLRAGCPAGYVAMFDEVDEGTAIFKVTDDPPTSPEETFIGYEGLPSDHYLRLAGRTARRLEKRYTP